MYTLNIQTTRMFKHMHHFDTHTGKTDIVSSVPCSDPTEYRSILVGYVISHINGCTTTHSENPWKQTPTAHD